MRLAMEFTDYFHETRVLNEAGKMEESASQEWWLSSGGLFIQNPGTGKTVQGALPEGSIWQQKYAQHHETDNGLHPQNIFRLVTRNRWANVLQELHYRVNAYRMSDSKHRNASNGIHFISRYQDQHNHYYAGFRVDGQAVIKKKMNGIYQTIGRAKVYQGEYDREKQPLLLPLHSWVGVRCETRTKESGVDIILSVHERGGWRVVLKATDGDLPFKEGHAGIRTDFMDVEFDNYRIARLP